MEECHTGFELHKDEYMIECTLFGVNYLFKSAAVTFYPLR